jgi:ornithine decarboxylase
MTADDSSAVFRLNRKFGAAVEDVGSLLKQTAALGLEPWGLSFNVGSQVGRETAWAEAIDAAAPILSALLGRGITLQTLNIGGGFPESYLGEPSFALSEAAAAVYRALARLPYTPRLVLEPGRRLVARSMSLTATVIARVERADGPWLFLDCGVYNALFEALRCQGTTRYEVAAERGGGNAGRAEYVLAGPTGDSLDIVCEAAELPGDLRPGDRLRFERVGAYTIALASSFNGFPVPPIRVAN